MSYNLYRAVIWGTTLFLRTTQARASSNQSTARAGRDLKPPQFQPWPWQGPLKQPRLPQVAAEASGLGASSGPFPALSQQAPSVARVLPSSPEPSPSGPEEGPSGSEQPRAFPSVPEACPSGPGAVRGAEGAAQRRAPGRKEQPRAGPGPSPPTLLRDKQGSQENSDTQKRLIKLQ